MAGQIEQQIADPYAEALISLGQTQNCLDQLGNDIRFLQATLAATPTMKGFLQNPIIKADTKKDLLQRTLADQVHPLLLNTLKLLVDRRRIIFLEAICQRFLELQRKLQRIALVEVTSAVELTEGQKREISERIQQMEQASRVELQTKLEADLIGGVIIKVGSKVIDLSLRGQLRRLALQLT